MFASFEGAVGWHFGGMKGEAGKVLYRALSGVLVTEDRTAVLFTTEKLLSGAAVAVEGTAVISGRASVLEECVPG